MLSSLVKLAKACDGFRETATAVCCGACSRVTVFQRGSDAIDCGHCELHITHVTAQCIVCRSATTVPLNGAALLRACRCGYLFRVLPRLTIQSAEQRCGRDSNDFDISLRFVFDGCVAAAAATTGTPTTATEALAPHLPLNTCASWFEAGGRTLRFFHAGVLLDAAQSPAALGLPAGATVEVHAVQAGAAARHRFVGSTFPDLTQCARCDDALLHATHPGCVCTECGLPVHGSCQRAALATPCPGSRCHPPRGIFGTGGVAAPMADRTAAVLVAAGAEAALLSCVTPPPSGPFRVMTLGIARAAPAATPASGAEDAAAPAGTCTVTRFDTRGSSSPSTRRAASEDYDSVERSNPLLALERTGVFAPSAAMKHICTSFSPGSPAWVTARRTAGLLVASSQRLHDLSTQRHFKSASFAVVEVAQRSRKAWARICARHSSHPTGRFSDYIEFEFLVALLIFTMLRVACMAPPGVDDAALLEPENVHRVRFDPNGPRRPENMRCSFESFLMKKLFFSSNALALEPPERSEMQWQPGGTDHVYVDLSTENSEKLVGLLKQQTLSTVSSEGKDTDAAAFDSAHQTAKHSESQAVPENQVNTTESAADMLKSLYVAALRYRGAADVQVTAAEAANLFLAHLNKVRIIDTPSELMGGALGLSSPFGDTIYVDLSMVRRKKRGVDSRTLQYDDLLRTSVLHECAHTFSRFHALTQDDPTIWEPCTFVSGGIVSADEDPAKRGIAIDIPGQGSLVIEAGFALDYALNLHRAGEAEAARAKFATMCRKADPRALISLCPFSVELPELQPL